MQRKWRSNSSLPALRSPARHATRSSWSSEGGQIHEIADRSDLLALNGALEAVRAGEGGRGFGLVAAEMRRLAERIGYTLQDVGARLSRIEAATHSTVTTTLDSREVSEQTAAAAREISTYTTRQSDDTRQVVEAMRALGDDARDSANSAVEARAAADQLGERARQLETLSASFVLSSEQGPEPA